MGRAGKTIRRVVLVVAAAILCGVCCWLPMVTFNDLPPWEAMEVARQHARAEGHQVPDAGGSGEYITQPDAFGGCEVEVQLGLPPEGGRTRFVAVRLRRSTALVGWQVTELTVREDPVR